MAGKEQNHEEANQTEDIVLLLLHLRVQAEEVTG
jgi:hypothetical protein